MNDKLYNGLITTQQRENLIKLRNNLINLYPVHQHLFNMAYFAFNPRQSHEQTHSEASNATLDNPCKSSCCIIGLGPSCGIPKIPSDYHRKDCDWKTYSYRVFIDGGDESTQRADMWDFLFSASWDTTAKDETRKRRNDMQEAIARLTVFIIGKCPDPLDWNYSSTYAHFFKNLTATQAKRLA